MDKSTFDSTKFNISHLPRLSVVISEKNETKSDPTNLKFMNEESPTIFVHTVELAVTLLNQPALKKILKRTTYNLVSGKLYSKFKDLKLIGGIHLIMVHASYDCDESIGILNGFGLAPIGFRKCESKYLTSHPIKSTIISYDHFDYINEAEHNFLEVLSEARNGIRRPSRTVPTNSVFSRTLRFDLSNGFPLLTTRPLPLRLIFTELMWFLNGRTDNQWLQAKGVHIWDANSSKEFLKLNNLPYEEGDIGPSYGFQFRYSGAKYIDSKTDYTGKGFDQLANVIDLIKNNPDSRRIIINLWNSVDISKMALPPCAFCYQFYVAEGKLSCILMQRSSDIALAGGWNIATVSLLTTMLAKVCGLLPGTVVWSPNDIHVYENQLEAVDNQLLRSPRRFPQLSLKMPSGRDITAFKYSDLTLIGYSPHPSIKVAMNG
jgi:thymidylate synthase